MLETEVAVIGGGPAGLNAAVSAAVMGAKVLLLERDGFPGGQLVKQTHKFFGSRDQYASIRGAEIASRLYDNARGYKNIEFRFGATVLGYYPDGVITAEYQNRFLAIKAQRYIVATGASEKTLSFPNNDLPGIYGAGAVQTLTNVYGIVPGKKVLMVGSGNIGLIVSYQLLQAGVEVAGVVEAAPQIGGYLVHAAKIRRAGVPIFTSHTVKAALGESVVEGAVIWRLDKWLPIAGSEKHLAVDVICIAVGLTPLTELLWQAGCEMRFIPQLGGHVPVRNVDLATTNQCVYVAGDASGIEEASSAMLEGKLAGLNAARSLGLDTGKYAELKERALNQLAGLRSGPTGEKIRAGLQILAG